MHTDNIRTRIISFTRSPRLYVIISGNAVEYMQRPTVAAIAAAAAQAAGYTVPDNPKIELWGGSNQVRAIYPSHTS
jgi:hypothetical protein